MNKIATWLRATWTALRAAPIVAPLLDLLQHRSVLVLLAGFIGYALVPQIQGLSPAWRDNLGNFVFYGALLLSGRFTIEGLMKARGELPTTIDDYLRALLSEIMSPAPANDPPFPLADKPAANAWTDAPSGLVSGKMTSTSVSVQIPPDVKPVG